MQDLNKPKDSSKGAAVKRPHTLQLERNERLTISGVLSVKSYNDKEIALILSEYILVVAGEGLNIDKLSIDDGNIVIDGAVLSLKYLKTLEKGSFLKRLAK
ncbi:MAG: YabP/YqfC family sporulation protein [Clostridiales bacterium]|jgi:sporulation protein YabP|nr:YabP/YqfC family sporulation protein [Clostridiales bacterium]